MFQPRAVPLWTLGVCTTSRIFMWPYLFVVGPNKPNDLLVPHVSMKRIYSTEIITVATPLYGISRFDTDYRTVIINAIIIIRPESRFYLASSYHLSRSQRPRRTLSVFRSLLALVIRTSFINGGPLPRSALQYLDGRYIHCGLATVSKWRAIYPLIYLTF